MSASSAALALILTSAVLHATVNAILKVDGDRYVRRSLMNLGAAALAAPFLFIVPPPSGQVWGHLVFGGVVIAIYQVAQVESYKLGDLSAVYPVARGASVGLTALGAALWFAEPFPPLKIAGLAIAVLALLAFRSGERGARGPALAWALLTAVLIAVYTLNDAAGVKAAADPFTYIAWFFVTQGVAFPIVALARRRGQVLALSRQEGPRAALCMVLMIGTYGANLMALRLGAVAEIAALRETSVVFGALIGAVFLHEGLGLRRGLAAVTLVAGLVLLHQA